jgi:hypothetical protein
MQEAVGEEIVAAIIQSRTFSVKVSGYFISQ